MKVFSPMRQNCAQAMPRRRLPKPRSGDIVAAVLALLAAGLLQLALSRSREFAGDAPGRG